MQNSPEQDIRDAGYRQNADGSYTRLSANPSHDAFTRWQDRLPAKAMIAALVANPPKLATHFVYHALTRDEITLYEGAAVEALREYRGHVGADILAACQDSGDFDPFREWCADTVEVILDRVLSGKSVSLVSA